jgi:hypothetical protein
MAIVCIKNVFVLALAFGIGMHGAVAAAFVPDPQIDPRTLSLFDKPIRFVRHVLPGTDSGIAVGGSEEAWVVRCTYYPTFTVKELDVGDIGDIAISVTPTAPDAARPACGKQNDPGEIVIKNGQGDYFIGAKGSFVYLMSVGADVTPFAIVDARTGTVIYSDATDGSDPSSVSLTNGLLTLGYRRGIEGTCSIVTGGESCWRILARQTHLSKAVASRPAPIAACKAGYGKRDPASESLVSYPVVVAISLAGQAKVLSRGAFGCAAGE